ncbi:MAG: riboflavin synthase [Acidimicrobiia bacterium]|nr:riboflavin synthase [Acidimicrobiia bacterium]
MFTGIVEELVEVLALEPADKGTRITVKNEFDDVPRIGDSIAVNGVCLTVIANAGSELTFDAVHETMQRSNLGDLVVGGRVNLERPMRADGRFDGHVVQGHVDGTGTVADRISEGESERLRVELAPELARYVVEKGSITVDGVSLTVTGVGLDWFEFVVIPHTLEVTTLGSRTHGERVNLEVDVIAKYVERLLEGHS